MKTKLSVAMALCALALASSQALAQGREIRVGLTGTFTGPTAALGIPYRQAAELFPAEVGGRPVKWSTLDDAGDPATAVKNARRFVDEERVDAIRGSTSPPTSVAIFDI